MRHKPVYRMPDAKYNPDDWFTVVQCEDCGFAFVNPRPRVDVMGRYYPTDFFDYFEVESEHHRKRYGRELAFVNAALPRATEKPKLLDVGCANGGFPRFAREHGYDVEGVEIAQNANDIGDFTVYRVPFDRIPVNEPRYDAVTAWAVLEHVHDPKAYLRKAASVLKPNGVFVFLVTNFDSISSRNLFQEDVPRHLNFFSKETVGRYLKESGLVLEKYAFDDTIYEMHPVHWLRHWLKNLAGRPPMTWEQLPETRQSFCNRTGLKVNGLGSLAYGLFNPLAVLDRLLMPLYAKWQKMTGTYGIGVFVARKPRQT